MLQDDTCDEEYRPTCGKYCGSTGHTHDIVGKVLNISRSHPPVQVSGLQEWAPSVANTDSVVDP
jgi:hypothetical protein